MTTLLACAWAMTALHFNTYFLALARVCGVQPLSDGAWRLTMESGAELVVSRTYRDAVLARLRRKS